MANDLDLKLNVDADTAKAEENLKQTSAGVEDVGNKAEKTNSVFYTFVASATLGMVGLAKSIAGAAMSLYSFAQTTLGLNVRLETSNIGLKLAGFLVQNLRKEFTLSLGFLKTFSDYLDKINFPITPITKFIDLMSKFNVVVGVGKGETLFQDVEKGAVKLGETLKSLTLANLKQDIVSAGHSLVLFAVNSAIAIKSLGQSIAREALFSQASRTIDGSTEQVKGLKAELDNLASTNLAVPVEQLYSVAGVAGAMGKSVKDIAGFVQTVSEGVIALNIPAEELAQKLGTIQTQLDLTEEGLVSLSDQINTVADTMPGKVAEIDIFEVLSTGVATAAKNFGLMKGETIALSGAMLALGEAPEKARTSLVNLLSSLQNAKNQTPDFQAGLAAMGTSAEKLAVDIKDKPLPALMQLLETMHGMDNAGRLDIATKLLGKGQDAIALAKMVDNVDLLKQAIKSATDATIYSGSVHAAYTQQMKTVDASMTLLGNSTAAFSESLTVWLLPVVNLVINGFRLLVNAATAVNNALPEPVKAFLAVSATVLSLGGAFRLLGLAMRGIGLLSPGMVAALERVRVTLIALNANVLATVSSMWTLARTGSAFGMLKTALSFLFGGTIGLVVGSLALLALGIGKLLPVTVKWGETSATVGEIISAMWETISEAFRPVGEAFGKAKDSLDAWLKSVGISEGLIGALVIGLTGIGRAIATTVTLVLSFGEAIGSVFAFAISSGADFIQTMDDIFSGQGIGKSLDNYLDKLNNKTQVLNDTFNKIGEDVKKSAVDFEVNTSKNLKNDRTMDQADTRAADNGTGIPETDDPQAAKTKAAEKERLEKETRDRAMQQIRDDEAEKIRLYSNTAQTQKQIDDFAFQQKILSEQQISLLIKEQLSQTLAATEQDATAKRTALINIEQATALQIKNLTALEQEHRNKAIAFIKEIEATELQRLSNNRALDDLGLNGEELAENKKRQLAADTAKIKELIKNGEYEKAAELGKKTQELAFEAAKQAREHDIKANQSSQAAADARENYNKIVSLTTVALDGASKAELAQADIAKAEADKRKLTLDQVRGKILEIEEATKNGVQLKVTADTKAVDDAKARIQQPTSSTHTINVVENHVQARAGGGYITSYQNVKGYAAGGVPLPIEDFKRKQGLVTGKGTGTSDEVPAMLSNGEGVLTAQAMSRLGVAALNDANYGNVDLVPVKKYAAGGVVGDDKLKQKTDELKKQAYEQAVAVFNDPKNQIYWRMGEGKTTSGSEDPNSQQQNFERRIAGYLRANNLPLEWRDMYLKGVKASQIMRTSNASFMEKAKAQLDFENQFSGGNSDNPTPTPAPQTTPPPAITSVAPPVLTTTSATAFPSIAPPSFTPAVSRSTNAMPGTTGKVSTVKFELPDGKSTVGHSKDPNFEKFFEQMNTVSGVTKV